jgi:hypothetical protein
VFPPVVDVLLKQAAVLVAYLRSAHMGSVLLLAAALLLPFAQAGQFLAGVARSSRTSLGVVAGRPSPEFLPGTDSDRSVAAAADRSHSLSSMFFGLPIRLASAGCHPQAAQEAVAPEEAPSALVRRDLERGPPFFL